MKDLLILFSYKFPYEPPTEQFLSDELPYHVSENRDVWIVPYANLIDTSVIRENQALRRDNIIVKRLKRNNRFVELVTGVKHILCHQISFLTDCIRAFTSGGVSSQSGLKIVIQYYIQAGSLYQQFQKQLPLKRIKEYNRVLLYSYWLNPSACAIGLFKQYLLRKGLKEVVAISRAHGQNDLYLPFKNKTFRPESKFLSKKIDCIYAISEAGILHLANSGINNVKLARLGVICMGRPPLLNTNKVFTIVSCSVINANKRVNLIAEVVSRIRTPIKWVHFGDGEQKGDLIEWCKINMPDNVNWNISGWVANNDVLEYYKNETPDLFINLSRIEGIPVSIMEAMSFGIPCVATNVGATNEIVINRANGFLIESECKIDHVADAISDYIEKHTIEMRTRAFDTVNDLFNAEKNYLSFADVVWMKENY